MVIRRTWATEAIDNGNIDQNDESCKVQKYPTLSLEINTEKNIKSNDVVIRSPCKIQKVRRDLTSSFIADEENTISSVKNCNVEKKSPIVSRAKSKKILSQISNASENSPSSLPIGRFYGSTPRRRESYTSPGPSIIGDEMHRSKLCSSSKVGNEILRSPVMRSTANKRRQLFQSPGSTIKKANVQTNSVECSLVLLNSDNMMDKSVADSDNSTDTMYAKATKKRKTDNKSFEENKVNGKVKSGAKTKLAGKIKSTKNVISSGKTQSIRETKSLEKTESSEQTVLTTGGKSLEETVTASKSRSISKSTELCSIEDVLDRQQHTHKNVQGNPASLAENSKSASSSANSLAITNDKVMNKKVFDVQSKKSSYIDSFINFMATAIVDDDDAMEITELEDSTQKRSISPDLQRCIAIVSAIR